MIDVDRIVALPNAGNGCFCIHQPKWAVFGCADGRFAVLGLSDRPPVDGALCTSIEAARAAAGIFELYEATDRGWLSPVWGEA